MPSPFSFNIDIPFQYLKEEYRPAASVATLSNGLRVSNFSSGHEFEFEDGTKLAAADGSRVAGLGATIVEEVYEVERFEGSDRISEIIEDVRMEVTIENHVLNELANESNREDVDVVIVPRMICEAIENRDSDLDDLDIGLHLHCRLKSALKAMSIRRRGRGGPICINRFCGISD